MNGEYVKEYKEKWIVRLYNANLLTNLDIYFYGEFILERNLRFVIKYLNITLLISVVFLSIPKQIHPSTDYSTHVISATAVTATNLTLEFSTFLGGSAKDHGYGVAVSEKGHSYVTGLTKSTDFPTKNAFDSTLRGDMDAFVTKFDATGSLLWSTYLGGSDRDRSFAIDVADDGSCYVMGLTNSSDFPIKNAYNSTFSGLEDVFLAKFSSDGSLLWSTYFGGNDDEDDTSLAVADDGSCYVTGSTRSINFPIKNAYDSTYNGGVDVFVSKFSSNGLLLWSTYLGGYWGDIPEGVAVTEDDCCYVTGRTNSYDFPTQHAFDSTHNGDLDGYITKFDSQGQLLWSTFLGGMSWDDAIGIAAASDGSCYVTGYTCSIDFPSLNAYNNTLDIWGDAFVVKFDATGSLLWSTFLGGNGCDRGYAIATTNNGNCYVTGETFSTNFPMKNAYDNSTNGGFDAFVTIFSSDGLLLWSTYLGGSSSEKGYSIAVTKDGSCFVTGRTYSDDFPTQNAFDNAYEMSEGFVTAFIVPPQLSTLSEYFYGFPAFLAISLLIVLILNKKRN